MSGSVDWKEFLANKWKEHRRSFTFDNVELSKGSNGVVVVDRSMNPPVYTILLADTISGIRGKTGELDERTQTLSASSLALAVFNNVIPSRNLALSQVMRYFGLVGDGNALAERSFKRFSASITNPVIVARLPKDSLIAKEKERFETSGLSQIRESLDVRALNCLKALEEFTWRDYQFYCGDDERAEIRRQAAQSYPMLAAFIIKRPTLRLAVDNKRSLIEPLQASFGRKIGDQDIVNALNELRQGIPMAGVCAKVGAQEKTIRRWQEIYSGKNADQIGMIRDNAAETAKNASRLMDEARKAGNPISDELKASANVPEEDRPLLGKGLLGRLVNLDWPTNGLPIEKLLQNLAQLPPDWFPKTREDWDAFCDLTATVGTVLRQTAGLPLETLYQGCAGKWAEFRTKCAVALSDTRPPEGVTEEFEERLRAVIPMAEIAKLPRDKVRAAAINIVSGLRPAPQTETGDVPTGADLAALPKEVAYPHNVLPEDIVNWIARLYDPDESRELLSGFCIVAEDMVELFSRKVVLPLAANETGLTDVYLSPVQNREAFMSSARILFSGKSAPAIFEAARHFHSQMHIIEAAGLPPETENERTAREAAEAFEKAKKERTITSAMSSLGIPDNIPANGWPPLISPVQAPNGLWLVSLTDPELLKQEGYPGHGVQGSNMNKDGTLGLRHCVGTYAAKCQKHGHHIVSIRRMLNTPGGPKFERLSTIEFTDIDKPDEIASCKRQHYGIRNGQPPEESVRAYEWFVEQVAQQTIPLNLDGVHNFFGEMRKKTDEIAEGCGYNWNDRKKIYEAMMPWGMYVAKKYRRMGVDEFSQDPEIMAVARQIEPSTGASKYSPGPRR